MTMKKGLLISIWLLILNIVQGQYNGRSEIEDNPGKTMMVLLQDLYKKGFYKSKIVENTMLQVDRKFFCDCLYLSYEDRPFPLTYGSFIAAPSLHATTLQLMKRHLKPNARALDIGCGSGYITAAMATMMGRGLVIGIDHMKAVVGKAYDNIQKFNPILLRTTVRFLAADGRKGFAPMAPYDVIHCGAFAEDIPREFKQQLKPGGRLVMAIGEFGTPQQLITADLGQDGSWKVQNVTKVWLLPLTEPYTQIGKNFRFIVSDKFKHTYAVVEYEKNNLGPQIY